MRTVDQNAGLGSAWNRDSFLGKSIGRLDSANPNDSASGNLLPFHGCEWVRDQLPIVRRIGFATACPAPQGYGMCPRSHLPGNRIRGPVINRGIQALTWLRRVVTPQLGPNGLNSALPFYLPAGVCVRYPSQGSVAVHQKSGAVAHLRNRTMDSKVPDGRTQLIASRMKEWSEVISLIPPVSQVAAAGPTPNTLMIDPQDELIVCAHIHEELSWLPC